ncbi:hypothetical protein M5689_023788 [Euphorbia peplus]|nr:hypothetical protein M5689_023788 [Euphorbia peplus]
MVDDDSGNKVSGGRRSMSSYDHPRQLGLSRGNKNVSSFSHRSETVWWKSPETKRKKRIAKYKFYSVEGKVKSSLKKGARWIKKTCSKIARRF